MDVLMHQDGIYFHAVFWLEQQMWSSTNEHDKKYSKRETESINTPIEDGQIRLGPFVIREPKNTQ